ncbi:MAG: universal stress protein [Nitrosopumilus sp.]|nr:universal stress protein [Nitrosopumilus sp.]MDH3486632.1 universal stress protein [Nitrosopumilus sp.]
MALSFQHILVPYDGTKTGDKAFNGAIQLAKKFSSKITILACMEKNSTFGFFDTKSDKIDMTKRNKIMEEKLFELEQIAKESDIRCDSKISNCSVASTCIVSYVKSHKIDLIVMGKSSKVSPEKIYHDSTVNHIYASVKCAMFNI